MRQKWETIHYCNISMDKDQGEKNPNKKKRYRLKQTDVFGKAEQTSAQNLSQQMADTLKRMEENHQKYGEWKPDPNPHKPHPQARPMKEQSEKRSYIHKQGTNKNYHDKEEYPKRYREPDSYNKGYRKGATQSNYKQRQPNDDYKNPCYKYMKDSYPIEKDNHDLADLIKKVKKMFKDQFKEAQSIKIMASKIYPMIYFEYYQTPKSQRLSHLHLRQLLKKIKNSKEKRSLFQEIYGRLFAKVAKKYYNLAIFAIQKANELKIKGLTKDSIFNLSEGSEVMFYYGKGKDIINFTLFDRGLRFYQFSSSFIDRFQEKHPDEHSLYLKFEKTVLSTQKQEVGVDLLDNEQLESDQDERINFEEKSIQQLKGSVVNIINKDVTYLDEIIDRKYEEMLVQMQRDSTSEKFKKIVEQHEDLTQNRQNFVDVRNQIVQKMQTSKEDKQLLKNCLKKLIIAEKQLESKLPIVAKKKKIFEMLKRQNLLIIEGQTGSGKSTQLPQMLCQFYQLFDNPNARPVLVTQPRRLATRTLAERVAKEMGEEVGGFVDYVASAGRKPNKDAKIIFQLDRLVLDEMTTDHLLTNYSCLVIDQAHERTISIDVILGFVKQLLTKRKDFKVIVTSASMDVHLFETYFGGKTLKVSGRTFPVTITYKDYQKYKEGDKFQMVHKICRVIDQQILHDMSNMRPEFKGHLLCFCSGLEEINELVKIYSKRLNGRTFEVFQLHGKVTSADQKKVFQDTGKHKFIFASRIAETAITIDGVRVVIDPGQDIELVFDQKYKVSSMKLQDITQSSAKQRAGRSGRTAPGHCFRLYSQQNFKNRKPNKIPEIKNSSLQTVVLRLKTLSIHDVIHFPYLEKPDTEGLKKSLEILTLIGALQPKNEKVTKIGELLIRLPIEPFLSRAIIEGLMFDVALSDPQFTKKLKNISEDDLRTTLERGVGNTAIEILSLVINFSNLFFIRTQERQAGQHVKYVEFSDQQGDFFFLDNIYRRYSELRSKADQQTDLTQKKKCNKQLSQWINRCYLNCRALGQINQLINEIKKITHEFSITSKYYEDEFDVVKSKLRECKSFREIILSCLITSFSANLCKFSGSLDVGYTIVNQRRPIHIYGTSNLSLLGIKSDWIICYDLYTGTQGRFYCKLAHKVDYQFMKNHIDSYIWKKFDVQSIEKENPYYIEFTCQLPSKYLQEIKWDLRKCETDARFEFLRQLYPSICEQRNSVSFFLQTTTKNSLEDNKKIQIKKTQLNKYLAKIHNQNSLIFRHNYVGNIFINFDQGFEIKDIEFNNKEFCIEVITPNNQIVGMIESDSRTWGHQTIVQDIQNNKDNKQAKRYWVKPQKEPQKRIKIFVVEEENKLKLVQYLQLLTSNFPEFPITFQETLVDKRRKIPQTKILLHYFAGTCEKDNILIFYSDDRDINVEMQLDLIKDALDKKSKRQRTKLQPHSMKLTKKRNGINVFRCPYDEYEIIEEIYQLQKDKLLTFKFQFPSFIKKFRQPQISEASKDNQVWKEEIYQLLEKVNIKTENVALNVQGFYKPTYKKGEKIGEFERKLRVDMHATLTTLDNTIYQKLKRAYDGRKKVLGCQKLHIRVIYQQIISVVSSKTFYSLQDEYNQLLQDYKIYYPMMNIELIPIRRKNTQKIIIKARSSQREDFIEPQRKISSLFAPKLIKLEASQFKFLDKMDAGNDILCAIEEKYKWKIYFGMSRHNNSLKVYCEDSDLKDIENLIKENIKKFKYYSEGISYKGKNLNKVKELLQLLMKNIQKNEYLAYQIQFQYRKVHVTADLTTFERIKNEILKLSNSEKGQCPICADVMRNPYKMINCKNCVFCWLCITEHLRTFRNNPNQEILCCPDDGCKRPINMFDVRTLLTEEQFEKICDIKISRYIERNKDKYIPCKYCEHIFDRLEVQRNGEINCEVCGRIECLKCNEFHPNYTCDQWKDRDNLNDLKKLGVKQCPKCKTGIEKNGGCNHMQCRNCHAHICWKCLETFSGSKQCYDHLAKQCGGIFD